MNNGLAPAAPESIAINPSGEVYYGQQGLSKREHFAAMAMQGLLAAGIPGQHNLPSPISQEAILQADALLAALEADKEVNK